jgi:ABC-type Zn uptake system ZnuABC Zn-binding protein ZnuA
MIRKILFVGMLIVLLNSCNNEEGKMFSTPENTIKIFYSTKDSALLEKCFISELRFSGRTYNTEKIIVTIKSKNEVTKEDVAKFEEQVKKNDEEFRKRNPNSTYSMYREFLRDRVTYRQVGDIEIVAEVRTKDQTNPVAFVHFLRNVDGEWKMIDWPR